MLYIARETVVGFRPIGLFLQRDRGPMQDVLVGCRIITEPVHLNVLFGVVGYRVQLGLVRCRHEAVGRIRGNSQIRAVDCGHSLSILFEPVNNGIGRKGLQQRGLEKLVAVVGNGGNFIDTDGANVVSRGLLFCSRGIRTLVNVVENLVNCTFCHFWASLRS